MIQTKLQFHYTSWALSSLGSYVQGERHMRNMDQLMICSWKLKLLTTFKDFAIGEDREKARGKFAEINREKYRSNGTNFMELTTQYQDFYEKQDF